MKKVTKIVLLALTLALLLAVPFAVSASENEPVLKIEAANLSFEDSVYPVFAVSGENVDMQSAKLLVWTSPKTSADEYVKGTENAELTSYADETIDGVACKKFKYTKIYAKNMTDDIYVRAYAEVDGEPVYSGITKYSVLRYAYNKLGYTGTATTDASLKEMLREMLDYGAGAQKYFDYKTDRLATNSFYEVSTVGGSLPDGLTYGLYLAGEKVTLKAYDTNSDGGPFVAWFNADGEIVSKEKEFSVTVGGANVEYAASFGPTDESALAYSVNADGTTCTIAGIGYCKKTVINIPEYMGEYKVTAIDRKAFENCTDVTYIKIPDTVNTIGARAFYGCTGLTEITIPESVTSIGTQIFYKASNLATVYYNSSYDSSDNPFLNNGSITKIVFGGREVPRYICHNGASVETVEIADSVTSIGYGAFSGCSNLTSIAIPDSVTSIGEDAFSGCSSLTSIAIPDSVTSIGGGMFSGCSSLTSIEIPDGVTSIGVYAFLRCSSLIGITIPDSVISIGFGSFEECSSFTSIEIPDSVTSIGSMVFYGCSSLTSIEIPDSVTSIGVSAFSSCESLTDIYYTGSEEQWAEINIGSGNSPLTNATIHYNYIPEN